jgi:hypothetical protein
MGLHAAEDSFQLRANRWQVESALIAALSFFGSGEKIA